jgi:thiol-disulfide isomerase/thioredoxin
MSASSEKMTPEVSPKNTYRLMAGMAFSAIALISLAIYSLSQINNKVWISSLADPIIQPTLRQNLPQFEYLDESKGQNLTPGSFEGHWTLLSFWAHWCGPCLEEMPALNQLNQQWQGPEFEVVTVNVDDAHGEEIDRAKGFLSEQNIDLPTLFDYKHELKRAFNVTDLPQHFLINPQMQIVWQARGAFKWADAKARDQLMKVMEDAAEQDEAKESDAPDQESEPESEE